MPKKANGWQLRASLCGAVPPNNRVCLYVCLRWDWWWVARAESIHVLFHQLFVYQSWWVSRTFSAG